MSLSVLLRKTDKRLSFEELGRTLPQDPANRLRV